MKIRIVNIIKRKVKENELYVSDREEVNLIVIKFLKLQFGKVFYKYNFI